MSHSPTGAVSFVGLVADDLTGATDSAVQFAAAGWDARLVRHHHALDAPGPLGLPRLDAITTGVRASSYDTAAEATSAAVDALAAAGVEQLFVKIDSTVRGSVAGQVQGALTAWRHRHPGAVAVICPAFPDHGRTVSAGTVLVRGVPVARTASAQDPVTPVTVSAVDALFPGCVPVRSPAEIHPSSSRSWVVDATSTADLAEIAATIERLGRRAVAVGSGGLAQALAVRWAAEHTRANHLDPAPARRILVAVSSVHPVAKHQLARLLEELPDAGRADSRPDESPVMVVAAPEGILSPKQSTAAAAALAARVAEELQRRRYDVIVVIGGDGALAVLDALGADQLTIVDNLAPGTPYGRIVGGVAHGLQIVTRSGGFGEPDSLLDIVRRLQRQTGRPPNHAPQKPPIDIANQRNLT